MAFSVGVFRPRATKPKPAAQGRQMPPWSRPGDPGRQDMPMKSTGGSFFMGPGHPFHLFRTIDRLVIAERALGFQRARRAALCQFRRGGCLDWEQLTALDANYREVILP